MAFDEFAAALAAISATKDRLTVARDWLPGDRAGVRHYVAGVLGGLVEPIDAAILSSPDPRDDTEALILHALVCVDHWSEQFGISDYPQITQVRAWLTSRTLIADELALLVAIVDSWQDLPPHMSPLRIRRAAIETLAQARAAQVQAAFNARAVVAGLGAFGPRLLANLAEDYLTNHIRSKAAWLQLLRAFDEVGYWAACTDTSGVPPDYRVRAVQVLLEVAGHPELTLWAVRRLPLHRLTRPDRRELADLLADRAETMPIDWLSEPDRVASTSIEVAYLLSLDNERAGWPGDRVDF